MNNCAIEKKKKNEYEQYGTINYKTARNLFAPSGTLFRMSKTGIVRGNPFADAVDATNATHRLVRIEEK